MTHRWHNLFQRPADRWALGLFLASAVSSLLLGWVFIKPAAIEGLIVQGGYYYILAVFALWIFYAGRLVGRPGSIPRGDLRRAGWIGLYIVAATAFAAWTDTFAHKLLFDEYVLQGTAWHMHLTKEIGTPLRAYDFQGTWLVIDTFLDKRPYFFPFLISLLHDLTGFRVANVFALNFVLASVALSAVYWLARALTGRAAPALLAVALLATVPLFGQNATGANMELLNVAMIGLTMVAATQYIKEPGADRLSFLLFGAILLAQTRYESVLFVLPVGGAIVLGWWRAGRLIIPWPAIVAPFLLVPYVWHDRFVAGKPILWQLREGEGARFAARYLPGNIEGARNFFFSFSPGQPNSGWLVMAGLAGLGWALVRFWQRRRAAAATRPQVGPAVPVVAYFGLTIAANLGILMFYYWSRLDDPTAARFALPSFFLLSLTAGWLAHSLDARSWPGTRLVACGLGAWLLIIGAPAYANRFYTEQNLVMHELDWELEWATQQRGPLLWITTKATMPFLLQRIPTLNTVAVAARAPQIAWHLREGTFRDVFVSQVLRPASAQGETRVDPDDALPASFHLRTLAEKRFGGRWIRISRVEEIISDEVAALTAPAGSRSAP